jgi:hypothetical protein
VVRFLRPSSGFEMENPGLKPVVLVGVFAGPKSCANPKKQEQRLFSQAFFLVKAALVVGS